MRGPSIGRSCNRPTTVELLAAAAGASAEDGIWLDVIRKMDEVYNDLLQYEVALEEKNATLEDTQQFISSVLTSMSDLLIVCSRAGVIESVNDALSSLLGVDASADMVAFARQQFSTSTEAIDEAESRMLGIAMIGAVSQPVTHWLLGGYREDRATMVAATARVFNGVINGLRPAQPS